MYKIRPAVDADGPAIAALIASVFSEYEDCPFVRAEFPELDAPASHYRGKGGDLWAVEAEGLLAGCFGFAMNDPQVAELHKVYLAPALRGSGLADRMLNEALSAARKAGAQRMRLWTDMRFRAGQRFYERNGFTRQPVIRFLGDAARSWEFAYLRELGA